MSLLIPVATVSQPLLCHGRDSSPSSAVTHQVFLFGKMSSSCAGSSSSFSGGSLLNITISEKLTRENFLLWQTQVLPEIYGAQLYGYLNGSIEASEKETTVKDKDGVEPWR
jgi:hypothetical protein